MWVHETYGPLSALCASLFSVVDKAFLPGESSVIWGFLEEKEYCEYNNKFYPELH